jgi:hypothetical protein
VLLFTFAIVYLQELLSSRATAGASMPSASGLVLERGVDHTAIQHFPPGRLGGHVRQLS